MMASETRDERKSAEKEFIDALANLVMMHASRNRSEHGPISGCSCGELKLGQSWSVHVAEKLWPQLQLLLLAIEATGQGYERMTWIKWLYDVNYGVDFGTTPPPPIDIAELAREYMRQQPEDDVTEEDWVAILEDSNGYGWSTVGEEEHQRREATFEDPACTCPKSDNRLLMDINPHCVVHGSE